MESSLIQQQLDLFGSRHSIPIWSFCKTQDEALKLCVFRKKLFNEDLQIFAKEICYDNSYGKRTYLVTNYIHFFKRYQSMKPHDKCYYELIREGFKCKLYFDIEYETQFNPNIDGDDLIVIFKEFLIEYIAKELSINITKSDIIDLNSTTDIKFSRHLIIVFPTNTVFNSNQDCGVFVRTMCDEIRQIAKKALYRFSETPITAKGKKLDMLFVYDMDPNLCESYNRVLFIDEAVYTKNRCFRLIYSSKLKNIHLHHGPFLSYCPRQSRDIKTLRAHATFKEKFIDFMDTLVCAVDVDDTTKILKYPVASYPSYAAATQAQYVEKGYKSSPFTRLDEYMQDVVHNWCRSTAPWADGMSKLPKDITKDHPLYDAVQSEGKISGWKLFKDEEGNASAMTYSVERNRFCMNIARCHRSNRIYFVVKFKEQVFQQKCFDPNCRTFISPSVDIPSYLLEAEDKEFEEELIASCDKIEKKICKTEHLKEEVKEEMVDRSISEKDTKLGKRESQCNHNVKQQENKTSVSLKRNLNQMFDNEQDKEIAPMKKQKLETDKSHEIDFQFDDEWDEEFISKIDEHTQNQNVEKNC
eukprot:52845_1